jgi:hypothetical protein
MISAGNPFIAEFVYRLLPTRMNAPPSPVHLSLVRQRIMPRLWLIAGVLIALHLIVNAISSLTGHVTLLGAVPLFNVDNEQSVPTFFSACLLLGAAGLLRLIAAIKQAQRAPFAAQWAGLALGFFLLALDEVAGFHERLATFARFVVNPEHSFFGKSWIVIGLIGVLAVAGFFFRFLLHLPSPVRWRFFLAGFIYIGGAVGVETLAGLYWETHPQTNFLPVVGTAIEEGMEMAGIIYFIGGLLPYFADLKTSVSITADDCGLAKATVLEPPTANSTPSISPAPSAASAPVVTH